MAVHAPHQPVLAPNTHGAASVVPVPMQQHAGPSGSLPPGTKVQVGKYIVRVEHFLSEGGFSHVYLSSLVSPSSVEGFSSAQNRFVLKRMAVPDKTGLTEVRKEVDVMKQLRPHKHIVHFIEASASSLPGGGGYEIFILMEYCPGGGIIDLLNSRLQNRLTESEILKIFSDTCEAVAHMHSQRPVMMHRDLKVENILVAAPNLYKLCDFGSTCTPLGRPPQTTQEIQALEADLNKHTTLQYRAPEMVDVWSRKGVDEKADIWALGVFLYKLCYYTTPFEDRGPLAIMNVQYQIPLYPAYSNQIKALIGSMLQESARSRPDVWKVYEETCKLRGVTPRLLRPSPSSRSTNAPRPPSAVSSAPPGRSSAATRGPIPNGLESILTMSTSSPALSVAAEVENVVPMRRGRPTKATGKGKDLIGAEQGSRPVRTGPATLKGPLALRDQPKSTGSGWAIPRTATGENQAGSGGKAGETREEQDLFAREAAAGFGDSFASPPPVGGQRGDATDTATFGDSFTPSPPGKNSGLIAGVRPRSILGTTQGLRPTPVPSRGPSPGGPTTMNAVSSASAAALSVPMIPASAPSPSLRIVSSVASAAKAIDAQSNAVLDSATKDGMTASTISVPSSSITTASSTNLEASSQSQVGPIDWRRPISRKPELISRSSQTSPSLAESLPPLASVKARAAAYGSQQQARQNLPPSAAASKDLLGDSDDDDKALEEPTIRSHRSGLLEKGGKDTAAVNKRLSMPVNPSSLSSQVNKRESFKPKPSPSAVEEAPEPALPPRPRPAPAYKTGINSAASLSSTSSSSSEEEGPESVEDGAVRRVPEYQSTSLQTEAPGDAKPATSRPPEPSLLDSPNEMGPGPPITNISVKDPKPPGKSIRTPVPSHPPPLSAGEPSPAAPSNNSVGSEVQRPVSEISDEEDAGVVARRRAAIAKFAPPVDSHPPEAPSMIAEHDSVDRDPFASRAANRSKSPEARRLARLRGSSQTAGPPLRAPKPQSLRNNAAITNLVSRYESLSASESASLPTPEPSVPDASPTQAKQPPPVPVKNTTGVSTGGSKRLSMLSTSTESFARRFPPPDQAGADVAGDRPRFRPTPSTRTASPPKAGPLVAAKRIHIPRQSLGPGTLPPPSSALHRDDPSPLPPGGVQVEEGKGEDDEEDKFAGVSNLKSKWETGAVKRAEQQIRVPRADYGVKS